MPEPITCAVVIPCCNESASIAALVKSVRERVCCVIVVDDGSTDETAALADAAGAVVVRHPQNRGKGAALRTGLSLALKRGFEWAFTLDGDGQHSPEDLPAFMDCARASGVLLVVGDRMQNPRSIPWLRRHVNRWMSRQLSRQSGKLLPDTQCGYRLLHLPTWSALQLETDRFEVESETLMAFVAAGCRVGFVPIRVIARGRASHIRPIADTLRWWRWWRQLDRPAVVPVPLSPRMRLARQSRRGVIRELR